MARLGGVAVTCAVCMCLVGPAVASGAQAGTISPTRAAHALARIIRRDARQRYRRSKGAVTVRIRANGLRVLRVHYSTDIFEGTGHDEYVLRVESRHGILVGVAVEQYVYETGFYPGAVRWFRELTERLDLHDGAARFRHRWTFSGELQTGGGFQDPPPGPGQATKSLTPCAPTPQGLPQSLFNEIRAFIYAATLRVHFYLTDPFSYCRPLFGNGR